MARALGLRRIDWLKEWPDAAVVPPLWLRCQKAIGNMPQLGSLDNDRYARSDLGHRDKPRCDADKNGQRGCEDDSAHNEQ
jgi:hypothetical protein